MSTEIIDLFLSLKQLRQMLEEAWDRAGIASDQAAEIGGEFEQEISTDLDGVQGSVRTITEDLDSMMDEARTLWDDFDEMEASLRKGLSNEENYKTDAEHIQEEMREDKA
jgi:hypothetical protein